MGTFMERVLLYGDDRLAAALPQADLGTTESSPENTYLSNNSIAWIVFLPFVTFENVICLFAIAARRKWKSPDVLFFSIVFNNLLTLLFPVTIYTVFVFMNADWSESLGACKFVVWCVISFRIVNVLQLAFLSLDRVWTLKWPGSYTVHNTANQNARTAGLMWLFGISIGTVPLIGWETPIVEECSLVLDAAGAGYTLCVVILLVGSSSISVCCVVTMVIKIKYGDDIFASTESEHAIPEIVVENETGQRQMNPHESRDLQNRQVCTIVGWVVIVDVLINELPFTVFNFIALHGTGAWLQVTITWCNIIFCACVPLMLCTISRRYRLGLMRVIRFLQVALGWADPPQESDHPVVHRQETVDSLDCYRPDDQDEPINFPEPLSQEVISFDDARRDSSPPDDPEPPPTDGPRVLPSQNTRRVYAETHVNEGYVDDENTARQKRTGMTSEEKRAHYQALGARRKKLLDAREKHRETDAHSKRKKKEKHRREQMESSPSNEGNFLRVESARKKGLAKNVSPSTSEVHPRKALSINRIQIPTENVTILKAFSADDDRLIPEGKQERLSKRAFHSVGEAVEDKSFSDDLNELQQTFLGATPDGTDTEKGPERSYGVRFSLSGAEDTSGGASSTSGIVRGSSGEASTSGSGSNELYDIPEDPDEDLLDSDAGRGRDHSPMNENMRSEGGKNFSNLSQLQSDEDEDRVKSNLMEHFGDPRTEIRTPTYSRPTDLELPLLSVPLENLRSPNVFAPPELVEVLTHPPLDTTTVPENDANGLSRDTQMAGNSHSLSKHQDLKSKKKGSKMNGSKPKRSKREGKNGRIKQSKNNGQNMSQWDVFNFELQDIRTLTKRPDEQSVEQGQNGVPANHEHKDNSHTNGYISGSREDTGNNIEQKKVSAKDLRARFRETKTSKILADNLHKEADEVIFL